VEVCPYCFYHATINANGDITPCFIDYQHKNLFGNIKTESFYDIWNGEKFKQFRINQLKGIKEGICFDCQQLRYGQPDSVDEHRTELLERLR
jgi:radical SAM protein with 4Fe4S-binding SPASM domain